MAVRNVGILFNPISGKGKSFEIASSMATLLSQSDFRVDLCETTIRASETIQDFVRPLDALLLAGGDGSLMNLLPTLIELKTPIYMLPTGNESLFAKKFSMSAKIEDVLKVLRSGVVSSHYVAQANDTSFFTMASVGFDADVIQHVARTRVGPIRSIGYILPALREARQHLAPKLSLEVDGREILHEEHGFLIIANTSQYALGLNFVPEADSERGELCARFFPYRTLPQYLLNSLRCLPFLSKNRDTFPLIRGLKFTLSSDAPAALQADGEHIGSTPQKIRIAGEKIRVLHQLIER